MLKEPRHEVPRLAHLLTLAELQSALPIRRKLRHLPWRELAFGASVLIPAPLTLTVRIVLFEGSRLTVVLPEIVARDLLRHRYIEAVITRAMLASLRPGMCVVDVGAQYGYHSLIASQLVGAAGLVLALEPGRRTVQILRRNLRGMPQAQVLHLAAGAQRGEVTLDDYGGRSSSLNTVMGQARVPARHRRRLRGATYSVQRRSVDDLAEERRLRIDFVKLDAEGAELEVIDGMRQTLRTSAPVVTLEVGDYDDSRISAACVEKLAGFGYHPYEYRHGSFHAHVPQGSYGYGNLIFVSGRRLLGAA